jgi:Protein of unknown function (DUF1778)
VRCFITSRYLYVIYLEFDRNACILCRLRPSLTEAHLSGQCPPVTAMCTRKGTMTVSHSRTIRTRRINLRATDRQEKLIRIEAETTGLSVTNFILYSAACRGTRACRQTRVHRFSKTAEGVCRGPRQTGSDKTRVSSPFFRNRHSSSLRKNAV